MLCSWRSMGRMARSSSCMCSHAPLQPFWMLHFSVAPSQDEVKVSPVIPVFKKEDTLDPINYLPIAVGEPLCRL